MGAWVNYGLGSDCQNMPGYMVLVSDSGRGLEGAGAAAVGQRVHALDVSGRYVSQFAAIRCCIWPSPAGIDARRAACRLDVLRDLNAVHQQRTGDVEIASRIAAYEMAFRMQSAAPELVDFSGETAETRACMAWMPNRRRPFAANCLLARRMVERGVRFVHLVHGSWDDHNDLNRRLDVNCGMTDQPAAALIDDLKQRGLLDETLVVWAGEFGRTPMGEVRRGSAEGKEGRDHHPTPSRCGWPAAASNAAYVHGATDEFGYNVVESPVHVHDLQATILHLLGIDHERLTYRYAGRDFRLTDVAGKVVHELIA